ncbi:unnamed protein product [Sympodiomycopsis kandeliae]
MSEQARRPDGYRTSRPKVVQPKPTNKDAPPAPVTAPGDTPASGGDATAGPSKRPAIVNAPSTSTSSSSRPGGPKIVQGQGSGSTILVSNTQRGNPVLQNIKNVGWEYSSIPCDYQMGVSTCALFLSLRYHQIHPEYIDSRINKISGMFNLRILLLLVENEKTNIRNRDKDIKDLTKRCLINNMTLMVAWNNEQAARYLENFKMYEFKGPELIKERVKEEWTDQMADTLTKIKGVNKSDAATLLTRFGSFRRISQATSEQLSTIPGFGEIKVKRLREAFTTPFRIGEHRTFRERQAARQLLEQGNDDIEADSEQAQGVDVNGLDLSTAAKTLEATTSPRRDLNANEKRSSPPADPTTSNGDAQADLDLGPDFDFGSDFDLSEQELRELERNGATTATALPPAQRLAVTTQDSADGAAEAIADEARSNQEAVGDDLDGVEGLTEEEKRELREAMAFSLGDDGDDIE